ncbi:sugar phosphate nucleotidyltransferase [Leptolyngbya sp. CCNP1308]|uniref:nucleotidyltransferase family protein n=1 Tax=Leptolyngbya sp. CCNP1308 TaxID=3110255 RepID=UPI002B1EA652|nr:sugar phosphate nucleotidyltransferase [Leptolyngbya sp. CCNP1308]MEA5447047.1 sugar phosphate nucleotidyltransferase [Leptolyngbya sp. CCNP1308]
MSKPLPIIGLIPAAGQGTRIAPLPMSKELFPIGFRMVTSQGGPRPKLVCHYLLEKMQRAGADQAFFILRPGKWDIPNFLGDGADLGLHLGYLTVHVPFGVPFSLNQAYPFLRGATVVMGFPDILFEPENAYRVLLERLHSGPADVVLGLFPTDQPERVGVVDFDESGVVRGIYEKSGLTHLPYMWAIAAWRPSFSDFLHGFVGDRQQALIGDQIPQHLTMLPPYQETPIGDVMQAALESGLRIEAQPFAEGSYLDIGTPENLAKAIQQHSFPAG